MEQSAEYEYSNPISVSLSTSGFTSVQVVNPFGVDSEWGIELLSLTSADSSVYISADNSITSFQPKTGLGIAGILVSGVFSGSWYPTFSRVSSYVSVLATIGTSASISIVLRFRRLHYIEVPTDIEHSNHHFTELA